MSDLDRIKENFILHWGEMGSLWGINRTMAQIHALLYISPEPLSANEIMDELQISRGNVSMALRELIAWFEARLPPECEPVYHAHYGSDYMIRYRGMRCINPHIQRKKINLHITHRGWVRPIEVLPDTDLRAPVFEKCVFEQFNRSKAAIDELLDARSG